MILLIDNYDSFSYNLMQQAAVINPSIKVIRNDELSLKEITALAPSHIILSPGPGYPKQAGVCEEVVKNFMGKTPILGVCLGHQAICEALGGEITHAVRLMHGKKSNIRTQGDCLIFKGLPSQFEAARYHSLIADKNTLPKDLEIIAYDDIGEIMAVKHRQFHVYGLQFHPESILTPQGNIIMENFLSLGGGGND